MGLKVDVIQETKTKLSDKINVGFPASGMGRLQVLFSSETSSDPQCGYQSQILIYFSIFSQIIKNTDLEELRELGSGTFGTVYHGKWRGTDVAIKRINDRCFAGKPSEQERMVC